MQKPLNQQRTALLHQFLQPAALLLRRAAALNILHDFSDRLFNILNSDRLGDIIRRVQMQRFPQVVGIHIRADEHDRNIRQALLRLPRQRNAVHRMHPHVRQQDIRLIFVY